MTETVACPNPACPARTVEGHSVTRHTWEAHWLGRTADLPAELSPPDCPACRTEGVVADNDSHVAEVEEELGRRCAECGVVTANPDGGCPHCGEAFPEPGRVLLEQAFRAGFEDSSEGCNGEVDVLCGESLPNRARRYVDGLLASSESPSQPVSRPETPERRDTP